MKKYYKIVWKEMVFRLLFHLIYMCAIASLPYIIKYMIDSKFDNGYYDVLKWICLFICSIAIGMIAQYVSQNSAWKLDEKFYKCIRKDIFNEIINKYPDDFEAKTIGEYSSEVNNNIASCEEYIEYIMEICESVIGLIVYAVYIFFLDIRIAIIIYIAAVTTLFLPRITGKKLSIKKQTLLTYTGEYTSKLIDLLEGFSFINKFTNTSIKREHALSLEQMENARYAYGSYKTFANVLNGSVMYILNTAAFGIIAILLCAGSITAGVATATISYIQDFMYPLRTIIDSISSVKAVEGVTKTVINEIETARILNYKEITFNQFLKVENIAVSFPEFELKGYSNVFEKGKSYAIIGESGTGKSTLLKVITGRLAADSGYIYFDDKKADYDICNQIMFYSEQKSHLYNASYEDNVTMFGSYRYEKNIEMLTKTSEYEYLYKAQNCQDLSGGEKQLVLLNRALLSNREILALDEPFSALNKELEYIVTEQLLKLGKTVIMITHNVDDNYLELFDAVIFM